MSKITILFGEMGAGKNYWGKRYARGHGGIFVDGDTSATPIMIEKVKKFQFLTRDIIEEFIEVLSNEIADWAEVSSHVVVAQALYLEEDRLSVDNFLKAIGHKVEWIWIKPSLFRNFKQLLSRPDGWKWVAYWLVNKPFFQKPKLNHSIIE